MSNLTNRGRNAVSSGGARLPALPASSAITDPAVRSQLELIREWLEVRLGARGDRFERAVTFRDLDPIVLGLDRRITALENESGATLDDCCRALRLQIQAIWDAIYLLRRDLDDSIVDGDGGDNDIRDDLDPRTPVGDPYFANVVLLVQDGVDASLVIQDRSTYADSVTITSDAEWDDANLHLGYNTILRTENSPAIPAFTSTGYDSRFNRVTGQPWTIECWITWSQIENYASHTYLWNWVTGWGQIVQIYLYSDTGEMRIRNGVDTDVTLATITSGAPHFVVFTLAADGTYAVDIDGTEVHTGSNTYNLDYAGDAGFIVGAHSATAVAAGSTWESWVTPLRVTKGVARPRGTVPTSGFPEEEGGNTAGPPGNAMFYTNSSNATLASPTSMDIACSPSAQSGIAVVSAPNGLNTIAARTGKVYLEFDFELFDDMSYVGLLANSEIVSGYPTTSDPFGTTGFYCISNVTGGGASPGTITNGTEAANALYDWSSLGSTVVGIAWDTTTGDVWFSIGGTWASGNPATATSPTFTLPDADFTFVAGNFLPSGTSTGTTNLRARSGATTYSPPTGFTWYA